MADKTDPLAAMRAQFEALGYDGDRMIEKMKDPAWRAAFNAAGDPADIRPPPDRGPLMPDAPDDWTPERERAIRERCERATPGPWTVAVVDHWTNDAHGERTEIRCPPDPKNVNGFDVLGWGDGPETWDAAFIAHARADLPAALAEIERLRDLLREADKAPAEKCARCDKPAGETAVRDGVDTLCMACSIDDLDGRYIDGESGSR